MKKDSFKDLYTIYTSDMREVLAEGKSFDALERNIIIGGREASLFFIDGLVDPGNMQRILSFLLNVKDSDMRRIENSRDFIKNIMPYLDVVLEDDMDSIKKHLYSGLVVMMAEGLDKAVIIDAREYPGRSIEEPSKEKSLRGAKDGFSESFMTNIALLRRRIRDSSLVFESHEVGSESRTDVCIAYMKGTADERMIKKLGEKIDAINVGSLGASDQTLAELLQGGGRFTKMLSWLNPFPKVRYTQRPDVAAAHITEGRIALIMDNTPSVMLIPSCIFDFVQEVDDYYFPGLTGNYFRFIRMINIFVIIFAIPLYLLMAEDYIPVHSAIRFFIPDTDYAIPLFWQFIMIEIAVDALKLASLNTPDSVGMSLSVIGALILGEFSIESGWFIPQTILLMAVVALASFTQPSMELGYAAKFARIMILAGVEIYGFKGAAVALFAVIAVMASTKTLVGTSYLYPLIPFDGRVLKKLIFRTSK